MLGLYYKMFILKYKENKSFSTAPVFYNICLYIQLTYAPYGKYLFNVIYDTYQIP